MTADTHTDAAGIEDDVRRTQDEIGETVGKLEEQLNPRGILDSFMGQDTAANAREVWGVARENPVPVALIAVGAVWLLATSETPTIRDIRERLIAKFGGSSGSAGGRPGTSGPPPETGGQFDRRSGQESR